VLFFTYHCSILFQRFNYLFLFKKLIRYLRSNYASSMCFKVRQTNARSFDRVVGENFARQRGGELKKGELKIQITGELKKKFKFFFGADHLIFPSHSLPPPSSPSPSPHPIPVRRAPFSLHAALPKRHFPFVDILACIRREPRFAPAATLTSPFLLFPPVQSSGATRPFRIPRTNLWCRSSAWNGFRPRPKGGNCKSAMACIVRFPFFVLVFFCFPKGIEIA